MEVIHLVSTEWARASPCELVPNPGFLLDLIGIAIRYHLWDYVKRSDAKPKGVVVLAGGGFERLNRDTAKKYLMQRVQLPKGTSLDFAEKDSKYLTLAGLSRMAQLATAMDEGGGGEDISVRDPTVCGRELIPELLKGDQTWYALMNRLREEAY